MALCVNVSVAEGREVFFFSHCDASFCLCTRFHPQAFSSVKTGSYYCCKAITIALKVAKHCGYVVK